MSTHSYYTMGEYSGSTWATSRFHRVLGRKACGPGSPLSTQGCFYQVHRPFLLEGMTVTQPRLCRLEDLANSDPVAVLVPVVKAGLSSENEGFRKLVSATKSLTASQYLVVKLKNEIFHIV